VRDDQNMSVQEAASVVQDARTLARKELLINAPLVYLAWGLVWLIGYGAMWLSVRGQHPYTGPSGISIATVLVLAGFAIAAVLVIASRAVSGIDGQSVRHRRILIVSWAIGFLILLIVQAGISSSVSARTLAFVAFAGPVLLAGLMYLLAARLGSSWLVLVFGAWLIVVGVSCAWLAPAAILAICALAGGGAFLLLAVLETRLRAHER
jgi:hypothetical protein